MRMHKVLFVDDEQNILTSLKRLFFDISDIEIYTADNAADGAKILNSHDIDIVVSDINMPRIKGTEFIKFVKNKYPNVLRMILTGYADVTSSIDVINRGEIYRYLTKPWNEDNLKMTIRKALEYSELKKRNDEMTVELKNLNSELEKKVSARTIQLEKALKSLKHLTDVLKRNFNGMVVLLSGFISLHQRELGAHCQRVAELSEIMCNRIGIKKEEGEIIVSASYLHDIGLLGGSEDLIVLQVEDLNPEDREFYNQHPVVGSDMIGAVDTMARIAGIIRSHHEDYSGTGFPDRLRRKSIPVGSRIIRVCSDYDGYVYREKKDPAEALAIIERGLHEFYDPDVVNDFSKIIRARLYDRKTDENVRRIQINDLRPGMYLQEDICLDNGVLVLPRGVEINEKIIERLLNLANILNSSASVAVTSPQRTR